MNAKRYWVFDWLEENNLTSLEGARDFLPKYRVLNVLQQRASNQASQRYSGTGEGGPSILAGTGIDLAGGRMVCPSPTCMRGQVDELFSHVWHYFDTIVVEDVLTPLLSSEWGRSKKDLIRLILSHLSPLLYLLEIGASDIVEFVPKHRNRVGLEGHAEAHGLKGVFQSKEMLIAELLRRATFSQEFNENGVANYFMHSEELGITIECALAKLDPADEQKSKWMMADYVFRQYAVDLTADVCAAQTHGLPLGAILGLEGRMLKISRPPTVSDVVFQLQLPVLEGVAARDLLAMRRAESEYFERFRTALRRAPQEHISVTPGQASDAIAEEIRADLVEPELAKIRTRLQAAERLLNKKVGVAMFVGAVATTCGLLSGLPVPIAVSGGTGAALTGTAAAVSKHLDTEEEISLEDMYFLWRALGDSHKNNSMGRTRRDR